MKNRFFKLVSLLCAFALLFSCVQLTVFARTAVAEQEEALEGEEELFNEENPSEVLLLKAGKSVKGTVPAGGSVKVELHTGKSGTITLTLQLKKAERMTVKINGKKKTFTLLADKSAEDPSKDFYIFEYTTTAGKTDIITLSSKKEKSFKLSASKIQVDGEPEEAEEAEEPVAEEQPEVPAGETAEEEQPEAPAGDPAAEEQPEAPAGDPAAEEQPEAPAGDPAAEEQPEVPDGDPAAEEQPETPAEEPTAEEQPEVPAGETADEEQPEVPAGETADEEQPEEPAQEEVKEEKEPETPAEKETQEEVKEEKEPEIPAEEETKEEVKEEEEPETPAEEETKEEVKEEKEPETPAEEETKEEVEEEKEPETPAEEETKEEVEEEKEPETLAEEETKEEVKEEKEPETPVEEPEKEDEPETPAEETVAEPTATPEPTKSAEKPTRPTRKRTPKPAEEATPEPVVEPIRDIQIIASTEGKVLPGDTIELQTEKINFNEDDIVTYQWLVSEDGGKTYNKVETATDSVYSYTVNDENSTFVYAVEASVKAASGFEGTVTSDATEPVRYSYEVKLTIDENIDLDEAIGASNELLLVVGIQPGEENNKYSAVNYVRLTETGSFTYTFDHLKTGFEGDKILTYAEALHEGKVVEAFLVKIPMNLNEKSHYTRCRNPEGFWTDTVELHDGALLSESALTTIKETDLGSKVGLNVVEKEEEPEGPITVPEGATAEMIITWENGEPALNTVAHFDAILDGFEGIDYTLQLQQSVDNENWEDVPGATDDHMDMLITEENCIYYWRVMVYINQPQEGASQDG